ncbi:MAG: zinc ribbon domain-containing protein [Clostridia bacterium]|nr:zinc ribbon domain-containing protein [Clostridia bacterium]
MICQKCNGEYIDSAKFCPNCGEPNAYVAPEMTYAAPEMTYATQNAYGTDATMYQQPQQVQYPVNTYVQPVPAAPGNAVQANPYDESSILLNIISFFKPFIGLILYLSWSKEYPKRAKGVGVAALVGVALKFFGFLTAGILAATVFSPFIVDLIEEIMWYF